MAGKITWLAPVSLDFESALATEDRFLKQLRKQITAGVGGRDALTRCVYVIRMTGQFIVSYSNGNSPVLYVGRGGAGQRLASHLKNWMSEVHEFGKDVGVEIRICTPRYPRRWDFFKNVEADLIARFLKKHGSLPFFNSRRETKFAGKVKYNVATKKKLERAIGIGHCNRPLWAIKPTPANRNLALYLKETDPSQQR